MTPDAGAPSGLGRVALVHDFLSQYGGAERVVLELCRIFPEAPVYTAFYDAESTFPEFRSRQIVPSSLQRVVRPGRFRAYAPLYPRAFERFDLGRYDLVVASSSAFAHRVRHPNCRVYCHTPPRFLYHPESYGWPDWRNRILRAAAAPLRRSDRRSARAKASYAANSDLTRRRVLEAYDIECPVIHPPLATTHLSAPVEPMPHRPALLMVSRLLPYKRVDLAVAVANATGLPLTLVGEGPERARLEAMAGPSVTLLGRVPDTQMPELFAAATVVLAPGAEDFGYGPVEAHWFGRPAVAVADGGALETITDGVDGLLVPGTSTESWVRAVKAAVERPWTPEALRRSADGYTAPAFRERILAWLSS